MFLTDLTVNAKTSAPSVLDKHALTAFIHFSILNKSSVPSRFSCQGKWRHHQNHGCKNSMKHLNLGDEISAMISGKNSLPQPGPETQRQFSAVRRKATILRTKLDILKSLLSALPSKQPISAKEMNRRQEMLKNLSTKGLVGFQRQIMREQDEGLDKLEETVISTKHIALAVNEELTLHTRLLDDLDEHVDVTNSRLQRVQKNLAFLNKRTKGGCACWVFLTCLAETENNVCYWCRGYDSSV
ncbi:TARGET SNARE COILED-COIL DOMAIN-CONTAINING PROTEIN-RELATED [Salix viminalis]|uniref:TARGET SNARE COILED-COIL DOMAIN-CONTAINING PROTEIN-RELATED n=1 Tax=Salix viminalis TaxID=40686 RepID=A0A9Q0V448_SALVM|nr:TARGET SNARE COILED-COIL DOMAIN-CONTAINING PROTEIN-RELATED [Salix viminalis]